MANSDYVTLQDLSDNPYKTRHEVGPGISISNPSISVSDAAGIYLEPLDDERNYNMRRIKIVDSAGYVLFEINVTAARKPDDIDTD